MNTLVCTAFRRACWKSLAAMVAVVSLLPLGAWAADVSPAATDAKAAVSTPASAASATDNRPDNWRYVWHNNQWWYYQPNGKWLIHDGNAWHSQQAATARAGQATRAYSYQSQPQYRQFMTNQPTRGGMDADGMWGNSPRYWTYQHVLKGQ